MRRVRLDELRQERQEEDRQLGVQDVEQECLQDKTASTSSARRLVDGERRFVAPRRVRQVEEVSDAAELQALERDCAHVQYRRQTEDCRQQVRHDAGGAAQGGMDACPLAVD